MKFCVCAVGSTELNVAIDCELHFEVYIDAENTNNVKAGKYVFILAV